MHNAILVNNCLIACLKPTSVFVGVESFCIRAIEVPGDDGCATYVQLSWGVTAKDGE
jgi:hypothetical protein